MCVCNSHIVVTNLFHQSQCGDFAVAGPRNVNHQIILG